jgi:hypothetical protein
MPEASQHGRTRLPETRQPGSAGGRVALTWGAPARRRWSETARLRRRFQLVRQRLAEHARTEGIPS